MHHPLPHLIQPRARRHLTPILPRRRILRATPQHLPSGTGAGPDHVVDVDGVGLLGPHVHFAAEHEVGAVGGNAREGVVAVDEAPIVDGVAVVVEGVVLGGAGGVEVEPLAFAAVEVLWGRELAIRSRRMVLCGEAYPEIVVTDQGFVAFGYGIGDRLIAEPRLHNDV